MAPSNVFSYLRHGHAKRNATATGSPEPVVSPPAPPLSSSPQPPEYFTTPRVPDGSSYASSSPVSPYPPQLPPIPRVASKVDRSGSSSLLSPQRVASDRTVPSPPQSFPDQLSPGHDVRRPSSSSMAMGPPTGLRARGQSLAQVVEHAVQQERPATQSSTHLTPSTLSSSSYTMHSKSQTSLISGLGEKLASTPKPSTPTAQPPKSGKSRLTLRNPMSLLMRRRSGQTLDPLSDEALVTHRSPSIVPPMPDNYDPSIRGRIVHDFSAPRPNRNFSYSNAYGNDPPKKDASPPKIEREHTPVFREHFDDDTSYEQSQAAIRAEQLANKDFLKRNSYVPPPPPARSPPPPPPLPKDSPPIPSPQSSSLPPPLESYDHGSTVLSPVQEAPSPTDAPAEETPKKRKSTKTPPPSRSRATSVTDPSFSPAGLPAHLTSRASRFSFQIGGGDSAAQEKLMEERHRQKVAEKASKQQYRVSTNTMDDDYDEYGMDDFDMDGGFEEEIPMLGEDDDYGGFGAQTMSPGIATFDFSSLAIQPNVNPMSPVSINGELQTPIDASGNPIGFAMSEDMLQKGFLPTHGQQPGGNAAAGEDLRGLGLMNLQQGPVDPTKFTPADTPEETKVAALEEVNTHELDLGDDLYFDDGMIAEQGDVDAVEFDEDVFDDPDGPLFERKVRPSSTEEFRTALSSHPLQMSSSETGYEADDDTLSKHLGKSEPTLAHATSRAAQQKPLPDYSNLNAYHSALADAANRAQAEGRFTRKVSIDVGQSASDADDSSSMSNSRPSLIPDDGRFSQETTGFPPDDDALGMSSSFVDDYDYSDYDSALEDDPMIAAANAEALANDYEGFYGQEFGFYASAQGETMNAYGGFFGPSSLGRSVSGRNAVREPNLTPITERSEYSTRNSFISLNHYRDSQIISPGLAQLARMSPYGWREDEDMSLDSLMKLRKGAFGSTSSLPGSSSNSPRNSSPIGMQYVPRTASPAGHRMVEQNDSSLESEESAGNTDELDDAEEDKAAVLDAMNALPDDYESGDMEDSDSDDRPDSPTLTASDYNSLSSPSGNLSKDIPTMPQLPLQPQPSASLQSPSNIPLPMSPSGMTLQSPSSIPLPTSPAMHPFTSPPPLTLHTSFHPPPSINSPSLPSATATSSTAGPRRQSLGLVSPISTTSPMTPGGGGWRPSHSRKGSAADSVAYVREQDEDGGERWVLERRRTAESGELELIGREIVEGGRI